MIDLSFYLSVYQGLLGCTRCLCTLIARACAPPPLLLGFNILQVDEAWRGDFFPHSAGSVNRGSPPSLPPSIPPFIPPSLLTPSLGLRLFDVEMKAGKRLRKRSVSVG